MIKEILEFSQIDPEVLAAQTAVRRLMKAIKRNMDPLMRNVVEIQGTEAMEFERWVKTKSDAKKAAQFLHETRTPEISRN